MTQKSDNGSIELDERRGKSTSERFPQGHSLNLPMPPRQVAEHHEMINDEKRANASICIKQYNLLLLRFLIAIDPIKN